MVAHGNAIACRVCGQIFPHAVPLLYHFDHVHGREGYTLVIQRNGERSRLEYFTILKAKTCPPVSRKTHFKLDSTQKHSQISSKRKGHAIFHSKVEDTKGQVNKEMEIDPINFTKPLIKKLDKPISFGNIAEDEDQNLDLELKL
ncbi:hypothetical protein HAX54_039749 [Datura stramonium]|uniref:C2H2-type domain-containing protein n=1 Tax=Datura stramonium TaxID=4076 RepID=A0ABS8VPP8_DATST|nr:hypothetical protein [Datura stramonium]